MDNETRHFDNIIKGIQEWQTKTFPGRTTMSIMKHFVKEVMELYEALSKKKTLDEIADEVADCTILLIGLAANLGITLEEVIKKKHEMNLRREWGVPDEDGVVEHINEEEDGR